MKYYLIDASAFIHWTENEGKTKMDLFGWASGQRILKSLVRAIPKIFFC